MFVSPLCTSLTQAGTYSILDVMHALNPSNGPFPVSARFMSLLCITFSFLMHGTQLHWGVRIQNALAVFKLFILGGMALSGVAVLAGVKGFRLEQVFVSRRLERLYSKANLVGLPASE